MPFTVMSYNIRVGLGAEGPMNASDPHAGLVRVADLIRQYNPDIVALQEVDRFMRRTARVDQPAWLAEALGMHFAHAPSYLAEEVPQGGRARYGNAILSREPILWQETTHLFHRAWLLPGEAAWVKEPRSMLEARLTVGGQSLTAYSLHLSTTPDQQAFQLEEVVRVLQQTRGPQVIMGDFNTTLEFGPMKMLSDGWSPALQAVGTPPEAMKTYPWGERATTGIDHIFVSNDLNVLSAKVHIDREGISDHNPVVAQLDFAS